MHRPGPAQEPAAGLVAEGQRLALHHCGRCHVVNDTNRYGGIGSTPSFAALRALPQADDRFAAFWTFNPHPAFMQVEGRGQKTRRWTPRIRPRPRP